MSRQLNLFGKPVARQKPIYVSPKTKYEEFVNAFVLCNSKLPLSDAKRQADDAWRAAGKGENSSEVEKVLSAAASVVAADEKLSGKSFVVPGASREKVTPVRVQESSPAAKATEQNQLSADRLSSTATRSRSLMESFLINHVMMESSAVDNLLSPDVLANVIVVETLLDIAAVVSSSKMLLTEYDDLKRRSWAHSKFKQLGVQLDRELSDVKSTLMELSGIVLPSSSSATNVPSRTAILKKELLKEAVLKLQVAGRTAESLSQQVRVRVAQLRGRINPAPQTSSYRVLSMNGLNLTWDTALSELGEAGDVDFPGPLSRDELVECARHLVSSPGMPLLAVTKMLQRDETAWSFAHGCAMCLLRWFPILVVVRKAHTVVLNLHEVVLDEHIVKDLLNLDCSREPEADQPASSAAATTGSVSQATKRTPGPAKGSGGRPATHVTVPGIVDAVSTFAELHGFSAQSRRCTDTASTNGVSLQQIRTHLKSKFPDLVISKDTIHRLMIAPHKGRTTARLYKGLVNMRIPPKQNTMAKAEHQDLHFTMAQVGYANELFELFHDEAARISVDDKNKVNVGTLAVSRFFHISKFFPVDDSPNYGDHDFPYPDSKIVPSGYLVMETKGQSRTSRRSRSEPPRQPTGSIRHRSRSLSPSRSTPPSPDCLTSLDKFDRQHVRYGRTGRLFVFNRATKFAKTSPQTHANDLFRLLNEMKVADEKKAILLISDNGPDWNPKFLQTFLYLGRLWRDLKLDVLVQTSYAAGYSRYNMIERAWAPLSWQLVGVTLPATLAGEDLPPWQQKNLPVAEQKEKEVKVFDEAILTLNDYWMEVTIDGYPVVPIHVPCAPPQPPAPYNDEDTVRSHIKAGVTDHQTKAEPKAFREELRFLANHGTVRCNGVEFCRCEDPSCVHCSSFLPSATNLLAALRQFGGRMPTPEPHAGMPDHYKSLLQVMGRQTASPVLPVDDGLPSLAGEKVLCSRGCNMVCLSAAGQKRHDLLFHFEDRQRDARRKRRHPADLDEETPAEKTWMCGFQECEFTAATQYQLRQHKEQEGHKMRQGRPRAER